MTPHLHYDDIHTALAWLRRGCSGWSSSPASNATATCDAYRLT